MRPGRLLATGRTAEVFEWEGEAVLKLQLPGFESNAAAEARAMELIGAAGLAAPRCFGTITVDGRAGLLYERVSGPSMLEATTAAPWRARALGRQLADLHAAQHATDAGGLPLLREQLSETIRRAPMPESVRDAALARIDKLPDGDALCHGDMHPGNVMLSPSGPMVIDWLTATRGPAAADVARTLYLMCHAALIGVSRPKAVLIGLIRRRFALAYLAHYRQQGPMPAAELDAWHLPIIAARLGEGVGADRPIIDRLLRAEMTGRGESGDRTT